MIVFEDGEPYVGVHVAHIRDANVGNRHDQSMSDDERRAFANLILLCKPHHDLVDTRHPDRYSAGDLLSWKAEREASQGLVVGAADAIDERHIEDALVVGALLEVNQSEFQLGGTGGSAPGAGGGGGGVVGSGVGGSGGPGGPISVGDKARISLDGSPGTSPGAGGGGGGLLLPGTFARRPAPDEGREGLGYSSGVDGQDGQASSFGDAGGQVFLEAHGGRGALAGDGPRLRSDALRLSMLTLANSIEIRDGLVFLLGAGWQSLSILNLGTTARLPIILLLEAGGVDPGDYTVRLSVEDPAAETAATVSFPVTVEVAGDALRIPRFVEIDLALTSFGVWRLTAHSDVGPLGSLDLMVKRSGVS